MTGLAEGLDPWLLVVAALTGYFVGSVNPAAILATLRGVDLRGEGSGNPGATNAARVMGRKTGVVVGLVDIAKGLVPALVFARFGQAAGELAGFMAVVGHITSPFLGGRGGKGVATAIGAVLGVEPLWVPFVLLGFGIGFAVFRRIGLASVCGAFVLVGCGVLDDQPYSKLFGIALGLLVVVRHQGNLRAAWRDARAARR